MPPAADSGSARGQRESDVGRRYVCLAARALPCADGARVALRGLVLRRRRRARRPRNERANLLFRRHRSIRIGDIIGVMTNVTSVWTSKQLMWKSFA